MERKKADLEQLLINEQIQRALDNTEIRDVPRTTKAEELDWEDD